jgi:hypothetical protein
MNSKTVINLFLVISKPVNFIFTILIIGQLLSFLNSELRGFLHITFYFFLFPVFTILCMLINIVFFLKKEHSLKRVISVVIMLIYLIILWRLPIIGGFGYFVSEYANIIFFKRILLVSLTIGLWYLLVKNNK